MKRGHPGGISKNTAKRSKLGDREALGISESSRISYYFRRQAAKSGPRSHSQKNERILPTRFSLHSKAESRPLPGNEESCPASFIRCDRFKGATRCDEGRLQIEFLRRPVPSAPQVFRPAHCLSTRSRPEAAAQNRPFRFGQSHCSLRRLEERLTAARGKMLVIRRAAGGETRRRVQ